MTSLARRERLTADGVVSGFVDRSTVSLLADAIGQASISALANDLLAFWPPAKPPFVLSLFEDRASLDTELPRLAGMAATGATVVVGAPAKQTHYPATVYGVDLRGVEDLSDARALVVLEGSFAAALVAVRSEVVASGGAAGVGENLYNARWTFRRDRVIDAMTQLLRPLRPVLESGILQAADAAMARARDVLVPAGESNLMSVLETLSAGLVAVPVLTPVVAASKHDVATAKKRPRIVRDEPEG